MATQTLTSPIPPDQPFRDTWTSAEMNQFLATMREVHAHWPGDADNVLIDPGVAATAGGTLEAVLTELNNLVRSYADTILAGHASTDSHAMYMTEAEHATIDHTGIPGVGAGGPGGGVTDHGALTGLTDDDHTQYYNLARLNTWLAGTAVNAATLQGNTASSFATVAHQHTSTAITDFAAAVTSTVNTLGRDDIVWIGASTPNNGDGRQNGSWNVGQLSNTVTWYEKLSGTYVPRFAIADITSSGGGGGDDPRIPDGTSGVNNTGVPVWQNATANFSVRQLALADLSTWDQTGAANNMRAIWSTSSNKLLLQANPAGEVRIIGYNGTNWINIGLGTTVVRGDAGRTTPGVWIVDTTDPDPTANVGLMIDYDMAFAAVGAVI